mgnify:CR=1 FL=1
MPKVFAWNGYRFHFFANEGDPREPAHVHVTKGRDTAKFWLRPDVALAYNRGFSPRGRDPDPYKCAGRSAPTCTAADGGNYRYQIVRARLRRKSASRR